MTEGVSDRVAAAASPDGKSAELGIPATELGAETAIHFRKASGRERARSEAEVYARSVESARLLIAQATQRRTPFRTSSIYY